MSPLLVAVVGQRPDLKVKPSRSDGSDVRCLVGGFSKTDPNPTATHRAKT